MPLARLLERQLTLEMSMRPYVFTCLFLSNIYVPLGNRGSRRSATESSADDGQGRKTLDRKSSRAEIKGVNVMSCNPA